MSDGASKCPEAVHGGARLDPLTLTPTLTADAAVTLTLTVTPTLTRTLTPTLTLTVPLSRAATLPLTRTRILTLTVAPAHPNQVAELAKRHRNDNVQFAWLKALKQQVPPQAVSSPRVRVRVRARARARAEARARARTRARARVGGSLS